MTLLARLTAQAGSVWEMHLLAHLTSDSRSLMAKVWGSVMSQDHPPNPLETQNTLPQRRLTLQE